MVTVVSFDVFETVLIRRVGDPQAVFLLLGRELTARGLVASSERFAHARLDAERRARRRAGTTKDPTLADIYREMAWALALPVPTRDAVMELELDLEAELLRVNPLARRRIASARARGLRIFFTSDTYFPADFIGCLLRVRHLLGAEDQVLVSCERGATKRSGELFADLATAAGVDPDDIIHVGNHPTSDDRSARHAGLRTSPMTQGNLTPDEELLERHRVATAGLSSVLAGAARLARLQEHGPNTPPALVSGAADVAGPTLVAYVLWVLREAMREELEVLYFLSREGQILYIIAAILVDKLGLPLGLRYLHASRQSLNLAALHSLARPELAWALTHAETNTVRTLLARLRLEPEDVRDELTRLDIDEPRWDTVPDAATRERLLHAVESGPLHQHVRERVDEARSVAVDYLRQEAFLDPHRCGIVDVSGVGSQFKALASLRERSGQPAPCGFLFFRSRDPYLEAEGGYATTEQPSIRAYFDDAVTDTGHGALPGLTQMLEMFCAADHGTVLGYRRSGIRVEPVLSSPTAEHTIAWGLLAVRGVIEDVARELWVDDRYIDVDGDVRDAVRDVLTRFWSSPSVDEASAWGSHPFEGTSGKDTPTPLAKAWTVHDITRGLVDGGLPSQVWFRWRAASTALSPPPVRGAIRLARATKPVLRRFTSRWR